MPEDVVRRRTRTGPPRREVRREDRALRVRFRTAPLPELVAHRACGSGLAPVRTGAPARAGRESPRDRRPTPAYGRAEPERDGASRWRAGATAIRCSRFRSGSPSRVARSCSSRSLLRGPNTRLSKNPQDYFEHVILSHPDARWVARELTLRVRPPVHARLANVVGGPGAIDLAEHPATAERPDDERPQRIGALGRRMSDVRARTLRDRLRTSVMFIAASNTSRVAMASWVGSSDRPHPRLGQVDLTALLGSATVPHHVARVLGINEGCL